MWFNWSRKTPQDIVNTKWGQFVHMRVTGENLRL